MSFKLDLLAIATHPDDVELACAGTILSHIQQGKKVGILDLTCGELGTRGTPELRLQEAAEAANILGVSVRDNVGIRDGFFKNHEAEQMAIIPFIRKYQPEIVLANAIHDRHPDHGRGAKLIYDACFLSGLRQIQTFDENGQPQAAWRPKNIFHYIQDQYIKPDFVIDITPFWEQKVKSIRAFRSQFYDPNSKEPESYISNPDFLEFLEARSREYGHAIGVKYGEGFTTTRTLGLANLWSIK
jgi:N-acetylglucosamine malate deacetylase 1